MGKAPDAFRTISEVADWLGVQTHVLRFWESKFAQVKPLKRAGGRRYYRPADMELLGGLRKLLHEDGLTIKGAQKFIRENGVKAVAALSPPVDDDAGAAEGAISGREAAAEMMPEAAHEVHPAGEETVPVVEITGEAPAPAAQVAIGRDGPEAAVEVTGEEPAPAAEPEPEGYFDAVDVSGEAPAPAVEPEPEGYFDAVDVSGEAPAPAAQVAIGRDGPEAAGEVTGEAPEPAPEAERKANIFRDDPEGDEAALPSFIRKPMDDRQTTVPPVTPGPPPLAEADTQPAVQPDTEAEPEAEPDHEGGGERFAGVGAAEMPDRAPVDFVAAVSPDPEMPLPQQLTAMPEGALDIASLRPLYDRLIALRARMG